MLSRRRDEQALSKHIQESKIYIPVDFFFAVLYITHHYLKIFSSRLKGAFSMNLFRCGIFAALILCCSIMLNAGEFAARLNYRICLPDKPAMIESKAAEELAAYLEKTYSEKIILNGSDAPIIFSVGFAPEAKEFSKEKDAFKSSGFGVFCRKRTILLTGFDDPGVRPYYGYEEGTLLSVYYFLRRYTGLEIYAPDPVHGEKPGKNTVLKLPPVDKPVFSFSIRGISRNFADVSPREMAIYSRKQLCHDYYWSNANVYYIVQNRWGKRFKDQPEMLGLHWGKRQSKKYPYHLPCLSNPKVKEVIVSDILEMIRKRKVENRAVLRMFSDAAFHRCECANCAKIPTNDDYFYGFILSVWEAVKEHYPKTRLFLQEKGTSHNSPPASGNLQNVVIDLASGYPGKEDYRQSQALFRKWLERGALPTVRLYARYPLWSDCPIINPHSIAENFRAMKGFALGQRTSDCSDRIPYAFAALTNFVHVNCLLDADADPDKLIREFCSFMYPGAADEMIAFYNWMEKRQENLGLWENPYLTCYPYNVLDQPLALLDAAAKKCTDPFWLNKLREGFDDFREKARGLQHFTANLENNTRIVQKLKTQFKERHCQPLNFSAERITFPLCPMHVPFAGIQDSSIGVKVKNDRLAFDLTAMEEHVNLLRKDAPPGKPDRIWQDDCFEVMIAPEKELYPYLHLAVNANGTVMALRHVRRGKTKQLELPDGWQADASIGKDHWKAELSIPMSMIREICPENKGRIGVFRTRVLASPDPKLRGFFTAHSGLDPEPAASKNHHDVSRYRPFTIR